MATLALKRSSIWPTIQKGSLTSNTMAEAAVQSTRGWYPGRAASSSDWKKRKRAATPPATSTPSGTTIHSMRTISRASTAIPVSSASPAAAAGAEGCPRLATSLQRAAARLNPSLERRRVMASTSCTCTVATPKCAASTDLTMSTFRRKVSTRDSSWRPIRYARPAVAFSTSPAIFARVLPLQHQPSVLWCRAQTTAQLTPNDAVRRGCSVWHWGALPDQWAAQ
mmetsp:Transcript_1617/g.5712  ORF Transcript_1617/g.5712 Transcript_1617/m.5712 type:complete len:224 (+) Transcript_1617:1187-1858(+)